MKPELSKLIPLMVIGLTLSATPSMAQTAGSDGTGVAPTTPTAGADTNTSTANNEGAFTALSPGGQKITRALFDAQKTPPSDTSTGAAGESGTSGTSVRSLDDIAAAKASGQGWGQVFKEMKADGLIEEKNLGQVISGANHRNRVPQEGSTADTTAAGGSAATANSVPAASAHQRKPVTVTLANGESVTVGGHRNRRAGSEVQRVRENGKSGQERREGQGVSTGQKHDYRQGIVSGTGGKASGDGSYRGNHKSGGIDGGHGRHSSGSGIAYGSGTAYGAAAHGNNGGGPNGSGASGKGRH